MDMSKKVNILIAPDSFKTSLNTFEVGEAMKKGFCKANPLFDVSFLPLSDGGDGSLDVITHYLNLKIKCVKSLDPLNREINSRYGYNKEIAVIEIAEASGLDRLKDDERDPYIADSFGTGLIIKEAIQNGAKEIILCLGGTATMDAGQGILRALGFRLLDVEGETITGGAKGLSKLDEIILPEDIQDLKKVKFNLFCDVLNPFTGDNGAANTYAEQKGADKKGIKFIEETNRRFADIIQNLTGRDVNLLESGGAAGGITAGLSAFLNTSVKSGAEEILKMAGFNNIVKKMDLIITAEGKLDNQTSWGKIPSLVAQKAKSFLKPVLFIGGQIPDDYHNSGEGVYDAVFSIAPGPVSLKDSISNSSLWLESQAYNIGKTITLGFMCF